MVSELNSGRAGEDHVRLQHAALADPHRYQAYQLVAAAEQPVDVAWLSARIGIHESALRRHLDKLVTAGLLVARPAPGQPRGRPRRLYRAAFGGVTPSVRPDPYRRLAVLLAEAVRTGRSARETGRAVGARIPVEPGDPVQALADEATRLGFEAVVAGTARRPTLRLQTCPFADAAREDPATVCSLHLGLAEGMAGTRGIEVVKLDVKDPGQAGCVVHLRRPDPSRAPTRADDPARV